MDKKENNGLGTAALILGVVGLVLSVFFIGAFIGVIGIILGIVALFKKNATKTMAIIGIILGVLSICATNLFWSDDESVNVDPITGEQIYTSTMPDTVENIVNNIEVEYYAIKNDNTIIVILTNNNTYAIPDLTVSVNFEKDSTIVSSQEDGHDAVLPGHTVVSRIDAPKDYNDVKIKLTPSWKYGTSYRNYTDLIKVESNKGEDCVIVQFTNNSEVVIEELEYIVVFYKNGTPVAAKYPQDVYDININDTITEEVYEPFDNNWNNIFYDDYKIFINQAHTFW